ncbi:enterochelin esterase [Iodobacter sp. LRB]|uniref:enterochelin esterase n=1 Tax=unclassified Iodobacter TaxID=235634 RepID=UPI000C11768E|nr:enterochelin esterase [Iodobacter sp. BJB302]PHV03201.1 enterochelin esterase [Iodobacter sp. BJB302]
MLCKLNSEASEATYLLKASDAGSESWWLKIAEQGTPLIEECADHRVWVTFLWRDPAGDESCSELARVYIDVNSVTDHHSADPQSLARMAGSDIWYWQVQLPADWRGSYCLIPVAASRLPDFSAPPSAEQASHQRSWWRSIAEAAEADPLNLQSPRAGAWRTAMSALHLPKAPPQTAWLYADGQDEGDPAGLKLLDWHSAMLANQRRVWVYQTGEPDGDRALVLLLDGQHWAERMPVYPAIDRATADGQLPAAVYVLIDAIDGGQRSLELPCNPQFWLAVQSELLPLIQQIAPCSDQPERTVIAGQSYGGLSAMYAALHWPERFGCVLSQSGSFWWPYHDILKMPLNQPAIRKPGSRGQLAEQLPGLAPAARALKVFQEAGSREDVMIDVNETMRDALVQAGHQVSYRLFEGGHDWLCWRGGLLEGLSGLLAHCK